MELFGNVETMNLPETILRPIKNSNYFQWDIAEIASLNDLIEEIIERVDHLESWREGRKPSEAFCLLFKLHTLKLDKSSISRLLSNRNVYVRAIALLYIRFVVPHNTLLDWMEPHIYDDELISLTMRGYSKMLKNDTAKEIADFLDNLKQEGNDRYDNVDSERALPEEFKKRDRKFEELLEDKRNRRRDEYGRSRDRTRQRRREYDIDRERDGKIGRRHQESDRDRDRRRRRRRDSRDRERDRDRDRRYGRRSGFDPERGFREDDMNERDRYENKPSSEPAKVSSERRMKTLRELYGDSAIVDLGDYKMAENSKGLDKLNSRSSNLTFSK